MVVPGSVVGGGGGRARMAVSLDDDIVPVMDPNPRAPARANAPGGSALGGPGAVDDAGLGWHGAGYMRL